MTSAKLILLIFNMAAVHKMNTSLPMMLICTALGIGTSLIGGALTGWIAGINRIKNAFIMGLIVLILTEPIALLAQDFPLWFQISGGVVTILFPVMGGWIAELIFGNKPPIEGVPSLM